MKKRIAIFASGSGTNLENILKKIEAGELKCTPALVFSDKPGAPCLEKARRFHVPAVSFTPKAFIDKAAFEARLTEVIDSYEIDLLVLAGYMRILSPKFIRRFAGRIVNIHPSLLPAFKGAHAIQDAFEAGAEKTGVTVHFATEEVDGGPIILQGEILRAADETLASLEEKVHALEYELYPRALKLILEGKVTLEGNKIHIHEHAAGHAEKHHKEKS